jgi:hypothetical protein
MAGHMGMSVEKDINVLRRLRWGKVDEPETNAVALEVDYERPLKVSIAVAPHQRDGRPDAFQPNEQTGRTKITEMPDFIHIVCQALEIFREVIMGIGEDKDSQRSGIHGRSF